MITSKTFWNRKNSLIKVFGLISLYFGMGDESGDPLQPVAVPETPVAVPDCREQFPIEHWRDKNGTEWWGFHTDKGFVGCDSETFAHTCRNIHLEDRDQGWRYLNLPTSTKLED